jgi:hypothetical protein
MSSPKRPPWVTRKDNHAHCARCGGQSEYRFMRFWRSSSRAHSCHFTYWFWWRRFKRAHKRCPKRRPDYKSLDGGKLEVIIVESWDSLLAQIRTCRDEDHERYTHDIIGQRMNFKSLVCKTCNTRFILK